MLKPTEKPPPSLAPRFAASITPGPAARDHREAGLAPAAAALAGLLVLGVVGRDPGRAEDRHRRPRDLVDRLEALAELPGDHLDVRGDVAVLVLEDAAVLHPHYRRCCGTWAATIPMHEQRRQAEVDDRRRRRLPRSAAEPHAS